MIEEKNMIKVKIKPINDISLTKYSVELNNIENRYWLSFGICKTISELNKLPLNKKILGNDLVDIWDFPFGDDKEYYFILTDRNLNIYFTKLKENYFKIEIAIFSFKDSLGYMGFILDSLNINFDLDFNAIIL